jgi:hypothetical protein
MKIIFTKAFHTSQYAIKLFLENILMFSKNYKTNNNF